MKVARARHSRIRRLERRISTFKRAARAATIPFDLAATRDPCAGARGLDLLHVRYIMYIT